MAVENRGGANGGPQYNPANVSGTGGAGQSGNYTGFAYGQNKAINQDRVAGNQAVKSIKATDTAALPPEARYGGMNFPELGTLFDPDTNPMEPMTTGVEGFRGAGPEALPQGFQNNTRPDENLALAQQYLPDLVIAAQSKDAPDSFKRFVNYLMAQ
jgi:hypothetical protein